jgi:Peptidase family M41
MAPAFFTPTRRVSHAKVLARIYVLLGGLVAEEMISGDVSTGAQNDLQKATEIARTMFTQFGMITIDKRWKNLPSCYWTERPQLQAILNNTNGGRPEETGKFAGPGESEVAGDHKL